jgi:hypothetical protein
MAGKSVGILREARVEWQPKERFAGLAMPRMIDYRFNFIRAVSELL